MTIWTSEEFDSIGAGWGSRCCPAGSRRPVRSHPRGADADPAGLGTSKPSSRVFMIRDGCSSHVEVEQELVDQEDERNDADAGHDRTLKPGAETCIGPHPVVAEALMSVVRTFEAAADE